MKITYIKISGVVFLALMNILFSANWAIPEISKSERDALIAFYNSTNGDNWINNSGWKDGPLHDDGFAMPGTENSWYGITCDDNNTTILNIYLYNNQLTGSIPTQLGNLTNLTILWLSNNQLTGSVPAQLGSLNHLTGLYLYSNQLTGSIPTELGDLTALTILNLRKNQLTGSIPSELGKLANVEELYLYNNQLTGTIPSELGNLTKLRVLILDYNQLTGSIPSELKNLTNMTTLSLVGNQLTGSIPSELGNLKNLTYLSLWTNQLIGPIPPELGNLTNLKSLWLSSNQLTGIIPIELINMTNLSFLDICYNHLYATDPDLRDFLDNLQPGWESCQLDMCPDDPDKMAPGICGCGVADTDSDSDGTADCNDGCPDDTNKIDPGICGCGITDIDSDGDGTMDCVDTDNDNDGMPDDWEIAYFANISRDGTEDYDNDGLSDLQEYIAGTMPTNADTDGDGDSDGDEIYYGSDPTSYENSLDSHKPVKPIIQTITIDVPLRSHVFSLNDFSDPDGNTLNCSEWQISTHENFNENGIILHKSLEIGTGILDEETDLLLLTLSEPIFLPDKDYWIRARVQDSTGLWSSWSDYVAFATVVENPYDIDSNGIDDSYQAQETTDTNSNGIKDSEEGILAIFDAERGNTVGVCADKGSLSGLTALSSSDLPNEALPDNPMPYGLFSYRIDGVSQGETVNIFFYFPNNIPKEAKWHKYDSANGIILDYSANTVIDGNKVFVSVTDGGFGDIDNTENGVIIDPSGPAFTITSSAGDGGGCFIATAAYGSIFEPQVAMLREFRDRFLLNNLIGKAFVKYYYIYSPPVAKIISDHNSLRFAARWCLSPIIGLSWVTLNLSPLTNLILILFIISGLIGFTWFARKGHNHIKT